MSEKTILVTGGAGFIGCNFIFYMRDVHPDYRIVCLDKLTYAGNPAALWRGLAGKPVTGISSGVNSEVKLPNEKFAQGNISHEKLSNEKLRCAVRPGDKMPEGRLSDENLQAGKIVEKTDFLGETPGFRFVRADICDRDAVDRIFMEERPDVVVNFAAESHVDRSIENPDIFLQTNIIGTAVLMDACRRYGTGRFHQVSTDEVYGDLPLDQPDVLFTEESPVRASSPYSASKASADLLVLAYHRTYGLPVTISRCGNNYGPYQHSEKLIPLMITRALNHQPLPVYGQGVNVRDWLYVKDHCRAIDRILQDGRFGEIYNVGGHNERRNLDIVKQILQELGKPESLITFVEDRKGHDLRYAIDAGKIERELGWQPETDFEDGIKETIRWYVNNNGSKAE